MRRVGRGWLSGLAVGAAGGFAALEFPPVGWFVIVGFTLPAVVVGPRIASVGGLLVGIGGVWIALLGRMALTCQATGEDLGCHAPNLDPWLDAGAVMLAVGALLTIAAAVGARRAAAEPGPRR